MKKYTLVILGVLAALSGCTSSHRRGSAADIIPAPASHTAAEGSWKAAPGMSLSISGLDRTDSLRVAAAVERALGFAPVAPGGKADIEMVCTDAPRSTSESYSLTISPEGIEATAPSAAGLFYSAVTLGGILANGDGTAACATIADSPRLPYRGLMLDVSRHFRDTAFIRRQLDAMASLKLNNLHLHLTDAAGWRMEIERYPRLSGYAAWRVGDTWKQWQAAGHRYAEQSDSAARGGFYTKQELRDLVAYAADRYINIIPEIEMPSHSEEVTAAYPELACPEAGAGASDFCPGSESTFEFLENVLAEVMDVFPSEYIHIGGDEAPKTAWRSCPRCAARMRAEKIAGVDGLQSYLIHRVEEYLNKNGRQMIGWDEIMEGGLAPGATVMSWRGTEGGRRAAADGHRVIMTPGRYCYLDAYQDAPHTQPEAIGGYLPLELVYSFEPAEGLSAEAAGYLHGLQGNLFAEYIPTAEHAEYMLYPRLFAIAERAWSPATTTDYPDFRRRAEAMAERMRAAGYTTFDLATEVGNRPGADSLDHHMAYGCTVEYLNRPWQNYPANGEATLTDGQHGGWTYGDGRWQAFLGRGTRRMDVVVDLGEAKDITSIGADFMQICGPGVFMPARVEISAGTARDSLATLTTLSHTVEPDTAVTFRHFGWQGNTTARYIRYEARADSTHGGVLFTDEIVVR